MWRSCRTSRGRPVVAFVPGRSGGFAAACFHALRTHYRKLGKRALWGAPPPEPHAAGPGRNRIPPSGDLGPRLASGLLYLRRPGRFRPPAHLLGGIEC